MLEKLQAASQRYQLLIHASCLMPNHFHLLGEVGEHPLELARKSAETGHARPFNRRHRKSGHVFQARYRAILCDKPSYLLELVRYIHLNPVRAGLVSRPEEWPWSSHQQAHRKRESQPEQVAQIKRLLLHLWITLQLCKSGPFWAGGGRSGRGPGDGAEDGCGREYSVAEITTGPATGRAPLKAGERDRISPSKFTF
jgi:REP element-mobilizing transposase RayT